MNLEKVLWLGCSALAWAGVVCMRRCKGFRNCVPRACEVRQRRNPAREDMVKERRLAEGYEKRERNWILDKGIEEEKEGRQ